MKRKQELHKHAAVRTLFEKLAHSSIMRLNSSSMSKLFDLMLMAFKYQLLKMKYPEELLQITLNHLNSLIEIMTQFNTQPTNELYITVKQEIAYATNTYSKLSSYDYILLKQILFRFFQGRNVKVSLFIQENLQSNSGMIYLPMNESAPPGTIKPGKYYLFNYDGTVNKETQMNLKLSTNFISNNSVQRIGVITTELGSNLYVKEKRNKEIKEESISQSESMVNKQIIDNYSGKIKENASENSNSYLNDEKRKKNIEVVKKEFNALADLINVDNSNEKKLFKVDLFPENNNNNVHKKGQSVPEEDCINIDRVENDNIKKIKDFFDDVLEKDENKEDESDLLDLMDLASSKK